MALVVPIHSEEKAPVEKINVLSNPVIARSLADACELVRLINNLDWKEAKKKLKAGNHVGMVIIEPQSKIKDWHGIGAYRGSEIDAEKNQVKHRFSYGIGRQPVHEVWITYNYNKTNFQKPNIHILGW